jgi:hypothetical protein
MEDGLIFTQIPAVSIASNQFFCQIPIRYKDEAVVEFVKELTTYISKIPIFHPDGTKLAVVKASQLFLTKEGEKAGLTLRYPPNFTVCELAGKTLFEIERQGATALKMSAELYTNDGFFLKWASEQFGCFINTQGNMLKVAGLTISGSTIQAPVGIQIGETSNPLPTGIKIALKGDPQ